MRDQARELVRARGFHEVDEFPGTVRCDHALGGDPSFFRCVMNYLERHRLRCIRRHRERCHHQRCQPAAICVHASHQTLSPILINIRNHAAQRNRPRIPASNGQKKESPEGLSEVCATRCAKPDARSLEAGPSPPGSVRCRRTGAGDRSRARPRHHRFRRPATLRIHAPEHIRRSRPVSHP